MATLNELVNETTNIKNKLVTCHKNLKNNLENNGVACSNTDKMSDLVEKVNNIEIPAQRVSIADTANKYTATNVEDALKEVKTKVDNGQNLKLTHDDGRYIQTRDTGNIDEPVLGWFNYFNAKGTLPSGYNPNDNDLLIENKGVGNTWFRQILYDVRSFNKFERMRLDGKWTDWRSL